MNSMMAENRDRLIARIKDTDKKAEVTVDGNYITVNDKYIICFTNYCCWHKDPKNVDGMFRGKFIAQSSDRLINLLKADAKV